MIAVSVAVLSAEASGASAQARQLSVCGHGCAYSQPAAAVAAAHDGDLITIGPGSYTGGFSIDESITVVGAGPALTTIRGGGPVITIGVANAPSEPTVTLRGLTITGGMTSSQAGNAYESGSEYVALGGGVWIPPSTDGGVGATVTIADSQITRNTVAPSTSVDAGSDVPCSDTSDCQFGQAGGGGIDSWGDLTILGSVISDNAAAGRFTSDADGGGIYGQQGSLTVQNTVITGNRSDAEPQTGRYAEGAGIMFDTFASGGCVAPAPTCHVMIRDSTVSDNHSSLTTYLPSFAQGQLIGTGVNAGGIHIGDGIPTSVSGTDIVNNTSTADNPTGEATAIDAAMLVGDSPLTMQNTRIIGNQTVTTLETAADTDPSGSTLELDGPGVVTNLALTQNISKETALNGLASIGGALAVFNFNNDPELVTVQDSKISGNIAEADSSTGQATSQGAGVFNNSLLELDGVTIDHNTGVAHGQSGFAQGGGIWNGVDISGPPVELTLNNTSVTHNALFASAGVQSQGGGLYTTNPVTLRWSQIASNSPDQCTGCS
jgi:hypothetical protein